MCMFGSMSVHTSKCLFLMQVTTRQLPHHLVVQSSSHVNHRNSTYPIEVNVNIFSTAFTLPFFK